MRDFLKHGNEFDEQFYVLWLWLLFWGFGQLSPGWHGQGFYHRFICIAWLCLGSVRARILVLNLGSERIYKRPMLKDLLIFAIEVWTESKVLVTGSGLAVGILLWEHYSGRAIAFKTLLGLVVTALYFACFRAWRKQKRLFESEATKHVVTDAPEIVLQIEKVSGNDRWVQIGSTKTFHGTAILIDAHLVNARTPLTTIKGFCLTVVTRYKDKYDLRHELFKHIPGGVDLGVLPGSTQTLQKGQGFSGSLMFVIEDKSIDIEGAQLTLSVVDSFGNEHRTTKQFFS